MCDVQGEGSMPVLKHGRHQGGWLGVAKCFDATLPILQKSGVGGGGLWHIFFRPEKKNCGKIITV